MTNSIQKKLLITKQEIYEKLGISCHAFSKHFKEDMLKQTGITKEDYKKVWSGFFSYEQSQKIMTWISSRV